MRKKSKTVDHCKHNRPTALICFDRDGKRQISFDKDTVYGYLWCWRWGSFKVVGLRGWATPKYRKGGRR